MKLVSALVLLALIIVPVGLQVSYIVYQLLTKGIQGVEALFKPSPKLEKFRSHHNRLFYTLINSYFILLFAALNWTFYEVVAPYLTVSVLGLIWFGSLWFFVAVVIVYWERRRRLRILGNLPPLPSVDSPDNLYQKWKLRYLKAIADNYLRGYVVPVLLITMGIVIIWVVVLGLYVMAGY